MSAARAEPSIISPAKELRWGCGWVGGWPSSGGPRFPHLPSLLSAEGQSVILHLEETPGVCREESPAGV